MEKKQHWAQTGVFLAFLALFLVLSLILPDRAFSEQENRYLQQSPAFSLKSFFSGRFSSDFESYTTDQFPLRDGWITLKARSELAVGKKENNGVVLCQGDTLIQPFRSPDPAMLDANLAAVDKLAWNAGCPVYLALVPGAAGIWSDRLPDHVPNDSQQAVIRYAAEHTDAAYIDVFGVLSDHAEEYIYYRTDHHWTSLGAYYGHTALMDAMGIPASALSDYDRQTVSEAFYGTAWSSSGFSWVKPDKIETFVEARDAVQVVNYPDGKPAAGALYDEGFLTKKDKYAFFLGGNTPLLQISTDTADAPSLLILRDSYMDALTPFLLEHFSEIHLIDLRYFRTSLAEYVAEHRIDNILVCYSLSNFCTDSSVLLAGK